jgi:hypothetical protein
MNHKRQRKHVLVQVGSTPEGLTVWHGVYTFYETYGLPLSDLFSLMWERGGLPDWLQLIKDMAAAGRPFPRCVEAVCAAVGDACYPIETRDRVIARIQAMEAPANG